MSLQRLLRCTPPARWLASAAVLLSLHACRAEAVDSPARPNIVLISLDTLRADRVGRIGQDGTSLTPSLDALSAEARVFTSAYAQSNETLFSHTTVFTGQYPTRFGALDYLEYRLPTDAQTLASELSRAGYRTEAVVAGGHLAPAFGLYSGFSRYRSMEDFSTFQQTVPQALQALESLQDGPAPFLLFVHGYDCHTPYVKPGPLFRVESPRYDGPMLEASRQPWTYERIYGRSWFPEYIPPSLAAEDALSFLDPAMFDDLAAYAGQESVRRVVLEDADVDFLVGSYDAAVRHADTFVGMLIDRIETLGLAENTVVIAFSDHGEDLLDHGYFNHRLALYDQNLHVPVIVRSPSGVQGRVDAPVALLDVYATVRAAAGLPVDGTSPGRPLLSADHDLDRSIYSESLRGEVSVRTDAGRLILPREVDTSSGFPDMPPDKAKSLDPEGQAMGWTDPRVPVLWSQLQQVRPR